MAAADFDEFFSLRFGTRWPALREALLAPGGAIEYSQGLVTPYRLDSASVFAARALYEGLDARAGPDAAEAGRSGERGRSSELLDACAAPGGKTLVMASLLAHGHPGVRILANELSSDRRRRLVDVLNTHLSPEDRTRVTVSGFDAAAAGGRRSEHGRFDAILLDAPCSSERHVLADAAALAQWSPARIRNLAQRQWALLSSAFLLLAPGGVLVYATCALAEEENDGPVGRLIKKYGSALVVDDFHADLERGMGKGVDAGVSATLAEKTRYGVHFLPDTAQGSGPLFVSRIYKAQSPVP